MQKMANKRAFHTYYAEKLEQNADFVKTIDQLIECGFTIDNQQEINFILGTKSSQELLMVLLHLKTANTFHLMANYNINKIGDILSEIHSLTTINHTENQDIVIHQQFDNLTKFFKWDLKDKIFNNLISKEYIIHGNEISLSLLWFNILKNAIEALDSHTSSDKYIKIFGDQNEAFINIHIENNGPVIEAAQIDDIFNKFYSTKPSNQGKGLGLSISQKIAEDHHGHISCISDKDRTIFTVSFKRLNDQQKP
jgi:C4-dicarboxylate-specific signal transduction histidine kinase